MTRTTVAQRVATAAVLTTIVMLLGVTPLAAQTSSQGGEQRELDGWIYGRGLATYSSPDSQKTFGDDGWAHGQGMRSTEPNGTDGWAVGQGMRSQQPSGVDGWAVGQGHRSTQPSQPSGVDGWAVGQGMRSQTVAGADSPTSSTPTPIPTEFILGGLVLAALLGAATATAVSHRRHAPSAH